MALHSIGNRARPDSRCALSDLRTRVTIPTVRSVLARRFTRRIAGWLLVWTAFPGLCAAEKLPATFYTTSQGLAHNYVLKVVADSRGFIWFATREGLSRFDGYTFTNYGVEHGLPSPVINDLLETREGAYLIATAGGLARLEITPPRTSGATPPSPDSAMFSVHPISDHPESRHVLALYQDRRGTIWVGTRAGLFAVEHATGRMTFRAVSLGSRLPSESPWILSLREDRFGTLWVGTPPAVRRLWPDGRIDSHNLDGEVQAILEDRTGHLWLGTRLAGLNELIFDESSGRVLERRVYNGKNVLPSTWINALAETPGGELWTGTSAGAVEILRTAGEPPAFRLFSEAQGLGLSSVSAIAADRNGNLWLGTDRLGAIKIARSGFVSFGAGDGFKYGVSLLQTRSGDLCFVTATGARDEFALYCFNGTAFEPIRPALGSPADGLSWGWNHTVINTRAGEWWLSTRDGVARFGQARRPHELDRRAPTTRYSTREGLPAPVVLTLLEDTRGDVWIASVIEGSRSGLSRWDHRTGAIHSYATEPNLPSLETFFPTALAEDRAGNVWIGFSAAGGIARYRHGRFDALETRDLFQAGVRAILLDSSGRIWIASRRGLVRVDDPTTQSPSFRQYTTSDGLSSNEATALVEDANGRLYIGTARGLDRLDPATGRIKHFSTSDGLPLGEINSAVLDRRTGHLWFAHLGGVVRLIPPPDTAAGSPPPILITAIHVDNDPQAMHPLGERTVAPLELAHDRNHLRIDFVGLGLAPGEDLRYQYRLEETGTWTAPSSQRTVNFANLAPGAYRFEVRAINADGISSADPASVAFTIVPPVWQRWWFLALAAAAGLALLYAVYRVQLGRAVEIATMRTRIATDLHDDIGANLTKIAILSEVARQQLAANPDAGQRLSAIARISRESVASMSDVVWAINPKRDTLRDTVRRMRQHAEEVCEGRGIALEFRAPDDQGLRVPIDVRRELFLIFKEALNNAVRHSRCRTLGVEIGVDDAYLHLRLSDDGVGFEPGAEQPGNGLTSMRQRAAKMPATLDVVSAPGRGTTVSLTARRTPAGWLRYPA